MLVKEVEQNYLPAMGGPKVESVGSKVEMEGSKVEMGGSKVEMGGSKVEMGESKVEKVTTTVENIARKEMPFQLPCRRSQPHYSSPASWQLPPRP